MDEGENCVMIVEVELQEKWFTLAISTFFHDQCENDLLKEADIAARHFQRDPPGDLMGKMLLLEGRYKEASKNFDGLLHGANGNEHPDGGLVGGANQLHQKKNQQKLFDINAFE